MRAGAERAARAAPMKSDGEKIPPEEPDPRLIEVAASLLTNSSAMKGAATMPPSRMSWMVE